MKIGDKVTWTETTRKGSGFNMSSKEGKITEMGEFGARVKYSNGRTTVVSISKLRLKGEPTELTESVLAMGAK